MKKLLIAAMTAALIGPGVAAAGDVSGDWKVALDANGTAINVKCHLDQKGGALTGSCGPADVQGVDPAPLIGTVDGATAKWAYDVKFNDMPMHIAYTATVKSDTAMEGTVDAGQGALPFTAAKQ